MNVLSLFDGISCGQLALQRAKIPYVKYYASEIDKYATKVTQHHFPNTVQLGDIINWRNWNLPKIDLLIGGSPCQGFSFAGKQLNFSDPRSKLFFDFAAIKDAYKPTYFLLENVRMKKESQDVITEYMGVGPVLIDSADFSAQQRKRLYWTNIPISKWEDKNIKFVDVSQTENLGKFKVNRTPSREYMWGDGVNGKCPNLSIRSKSWAVTTKQDRAPNAGLVEYEDFCRYLTPVECERLQTIPDNYTEILSTTRRYHVIGNGWTVDVITHILKGLKN